MTCGGPTPRPSTIVRMSRRVLLVAIAAVVSSVAACSRAEPAKRYELKGQVLEVKADQQSLTVRHEDIPNFMPAMTMPYRVANPDLLKGREPGELITATLEVQEGQGQLVAITHVGAAPLPGNANQMAMATGLLQEGGLRWRRDCCRREMRCRTRRSSIRTIGAGRFLNGRAHSLS
jgi:Cu/Ag efflux protein CusF